MPNSKPSTLAVSFIVPALNEALLLTKLLDSIDAITTSDRITTKEVILVDAGSTDSTVELATNRGCTVISAPPGSVSRSRNLGAEQASGDILAFIDADCELPPDWLRELAVVFEQQHVVAAGSAMGANPQSSNWVEQTWFELAHRQHGSQLTTEVDWLATFNLAVRKSAFTNTGGFDESMQTCEDVEFGYRLSQQGVLQKLEKCPVIHHGESKTIKEFFHREAWRARGAINIALKHWNNPRELLSFALPMVIVSGAIAGLIILACAVFGYRPWSLSNTALITTAIIIGVLPLLLLTLRRRVSVHRLLPALLMMMVYFFARAVGTFQSFTRVERAP